MPRTGGVYSPPAGTKGVPGTTIQSAPYNAFIDDLTDDANAARPITAGGTGSTSASAARSTLGLAIGSDVQAYDAGLASIAGLTTAADKMIYTTAADVYATTALTPFARTLLDDATLADAKSTLALGTFSTSGVVSNMTGANYATGGDIATFLPSDFGVGKHGLFVSKIPGASSYRFSLWDGVNNNGTIDITSTNFTWNGNTVWTSGNDGPGSGLNADLFDNQDASFYTNASNLNAGTLADARIPGTLAGRTWSSFSAFSPVTYAAGGDIVRFGPSDFGVGKHALFIAKAAAVSTYNVGLWDGVAGDGTINFTSSTLTHAGSTVLTAANLASNFAAIGHNTVGSIAMLRRVGAGAFIQGDTSIGSQLLYSNADASATGSNPDGTWTCLGRCTGGAAGGASVTIWKRTA